MKLFKIECWNKNGYQIGSYYVVAPNITTAKKLVREWEPWVGKMEYEVLPVLMASQD